MPAPAVPALAATLLLVRDGPQGLEVLMGSRPSSGSFAGAVVFPGGVVDEADRDAALTGLGDLPDGVLRAAALRETAEEVGIVLTTPPLERVPPLRGLSPAGFYGALADAGVRLAGERLLRVANWVTPTRLPRRFDTHFYLVGVDAGVEPDAGSGELVEVRWVRPAEVLETGRAGAVPMVLPTRSHLALLAGFETVAAVTAHARELPEVTPVTPRMVEREEGWVPVLPGEAGYDEAES
jgi:8-oxo-dGTP pyrophosphatase MutT (NUDIX family)